MWLHISKAFVFFISLNLLNLVCDAVRLIREQGLRPDSYFYHNGDGGYAYHYQLETETSIYFKCMQYDKLKCRGRAILRLGGAFRHKQHHNHPPDPDLVGERHFRANVLNQVRNARFVSFQDIIDEARRDRRYSRRVRSRMNLRRLRTPMHRARVNSFPPVPQTLRELTQALLEHPRISVTVDGEENIYSGSVTADDGSHHVLFTSPRMKNIMEQCTLLQGDGTFRARPAVPHSAQVFVIVTTYKAGVVPLAWVLMENKTRAGYSAVFRLLKQVCPNLNPTHIISDWELPQQLAWREAFPNMGLSIVFHQDPSRVNYFVTDATIQGCLWHLARAFVKKANRLRILRYRNAYPDVLNFIRNACSIALLPEELFEEGLNVLKTKALQINHIAAYLVRDFFSFVEIRWLGRPCRRSFMNFWRSLHRTNNACESHNRMLRKAVGAYRPNVYAFIEALGRLEHNAYLDMIHMRAGGDARVTRRWQSVYSDRTLLALCNDLEEDIFHNRDETIWNFIERASFLLHGAFDDHVQREVGEQPRRRRR